MVAKILRVVAGKTKRCCATMAGLGCLLIAAAIWCGYVSGEQLAKATTETSGRNAVSALEENVIRFTNQERVQRELPPLRHSAALSLLAKQHSEHMCRTKVFQHESEAFPKGWEKFVQRLNSVGLRYGGENIGYQTLTGQPVKWARQMVHGWMKSPDHRKNILERDFRYLGVGVSACPNKIGYATQVFSPSAGQAPQDRTRE